MCLAVCPDFIQILCLDHLLIKSSVDHQSYWLIVSKRSIEPIACNSKSNSNPVLFLRSLVHSPQQRSPSTAGASVIGLAFDDGVIIAADNLASYGSLARFHDCLRVRKVNKDTILGAGGDFADFQHVWKSIEQKQIEEESAMDDTHSGPLALHTWLTRVQYNKRCNFDPYWVEWVVGGLQDGVPFLGYVDKLGTSYQDRAVGSGRLGQLAMPLLREYTDNFTISLDEQKAREVVVKALEVLYYRDCYTSSKYSLAVIAKNKGAQIEGPFKLETKWQAALFVKGYE